MASSDALNQVPATEPLPDNVTLRIVILAHGNRNEDDLYLVLNLDTTIGSLKERIQQTLAQQPSPDTQRLIYHGRPLQDNSSTLRQILRLEQSPSNTAIAAHVLHLVIRDGQTSVSQPAAASAVPQTQHPAAANVGPRVPAVGTNQMQPPQMPQLPLNFLPQPFAAPLQTAQMMLHNQMHMMQHQMQHQMAVNAAQQAANRMASSQNPDGGQAQLSRPTNQVPNTHGTLDPARGLVGEQRLPQGQDSSTQVAQESSNNQNPTPSSTQPTTPAIRVQETIGPHGERIRTMINNGSLAYRIGSPGMPNPFERPASAPGLSPTGEEAPVIPGPTSQPLNAMHPIQTPTIPSVHRQPQAPFPHMFPLGRPLPQPPTFMNVPGNTFQGVSAPQNSQQHPSETVAWLLNSSAGPKGIVFAPGHGFFSSQRPETPVQTMSRTTQPTPTATVPVNSSSVARPATGLPPGQTQLARLQERIQQRAQPQGVQGQARRPNVEEHDLLNLVIQRGWLFLRLYMFIFVLSESGTWRRFIMLSLAVLVCVLPRQNPFTNVFAVMRRHVDNLIGPPDIARRQEQQRPPARPEQNATPANENNNEHPRQAGTQSGAANVPPQSSSTSSSPPSPEENARRLLREHQQRNPSVIRDMFYRVEQAMALFLASLVPGVGERHVRAREEARRVIEEEQRRRQEEQQRAEEQQKTESNNEAKGENKQESVITEAAHQSSGTSSGVDNTDTGSSSGVRLRTGDNS